MLTTQSVEDKIVNALRDKTMQTNELLASCGGPTSTFHLHLKRLVEDKRIMKVKQGRRVSYALAEESWRLHNLAEDRTALELHIIKNARSIMEQCMTFETSANIIEVNEVTQLRTFMLSKSVEKLRKVKPELPDIDRGRDESDDDDLFDAGEKREQYIAGRNLVFTYNFWLDMLETLKTL